MRSIKELKNIEPQDMTNKEFEKCINRPPDPIETMLCGCGNIIAVGCEFCEECIDGYRGEDET